MESYSENIELILAAIPELKDKQSQKRIPSTNPGTCKFEVRDASGNSFILYLADKQDYCLVKQSFQLLTMLRENKILVPEPLSYGVCDQNMAAYLLTGRLEGQPTSRFLPGQHKVSQYLLGQEMAIFINALHGCAVVDKAGSWSCQISARVARVTALSGPAPQRDLAGLLDFIKANQDIVKQRPQCILHGGLRAENLLCGPGSAVSLAAWENWHYGDPLADLVPVLTDMRKISQHFVTGFLDCYFSYKVDVHSFRCLTFYTALNKLEQYQAAQPEEQARLVQEIRAMGKDYRDFSSVVPKWYKPLPRMSLARPAKSTGK